MAVDELTLKALAHSVDPKAYSSLVRAKLASGQLTPSKLLETFASGYLDSNDNGDALLLEPYLTTALAPPDPLLNPSLFLAHITTHNPLAFQSQSLPSIISYALRAQLTIDNAASKSGDENDYQLPPAAIHGLLLLLPTSVPDLIDLAAIIFTAPSLLPPSPSTEDVLYEGITVVDKVTEILSLTPQVWFPTINGNESKEELLANLEVGDKVVMLKNAMRSWAGIGFDVGGGMPGMLGEGLTGRSSSGGNDMDLFAMAGVTAEDGDVDLLANLDLLTAASQHQSQPPLETETSEDLFSLPMTISTLLPEPSPSDLPSPFSIEFLDILRRSLPQEQLVILHTWITDLAPPSLGRPESIIFNLVKASIAELTAQDPLQLSPIQAVTTSKKGSASKSLNAIGSRSWIRCWVFGRLFPLLKDVVNQLGLSVSLADPICQYLTFSSDLLQTLRGTASEHGSGGVGLDDIETFGMDMELDLDAELETDEGSEDLPKYPNLLEVLLSELTSAGFITPSQQMDLTTQLGVLESDVPRVQWTVGDEADVAQGDESGLISYLEGKMSLDATSEDLKTFVFDKMMVDFSSQKIVSDVVAKQMASSELYLLSHLCQFYINNPFYLPVLYLHVDPSEVIGRLLYFIESFESDSYGNANETLAMYGEIVLFVETSLRLLEVSDSFVFTFNLNGLKKTISTSSLRACTQVHLPEKLGDESLQLLNGWVTALYGSDGISDDILRATNPRSLLKMSTTIVSQSILAFQKLVIDHDGLVSGLSYFFQPLLNWLLPGVLNWLVMEIRRLGVFSSSHLQVLQILLGACPKVILQVSGPTVTHLFASGSDPYSQGSSIDSPAIVKRIKDSALLVSFDIFASQPLSPSIPLQSHVRSLFSLSSATTPLQAKLLRESHHLVSKDALSLLWDSFTSSNCDPTFGTRRFAFAALFLSERRISTATMLTSRWVFEVLDGLEQTDGYLIRLLSEAVSVFLKVTVYLDPPAQVLVTAFLGELESRRIKTSTVGQFGTLFIKRFSTVGI